MTYLFFRHVLRSQIVGHEPVDPVCDLGGGDTDAGEDELQELDGGGTQHGGNGHEEGEFRTGGSAHAD